MQTDPWMGWSFSIGRFLLRYTDTVTWEGDETWNMNPGQW